MLQRMLVGLFGTCLFLMAGWAYAHPSVFIKLRVQEALPSESNSPTFKPIKGVARNQEPVTFGIPLHFDSNILLLEQLVLVGAPNFQFRILRKWPNEKIQWLLVDAQASVKANDYTESLFLTVGTSVISQQKLARESGDTITVNTGPAQFTVHKKKFNLFDKVVVNGAEVVASSPTSGVVLTGEDGKLYRSNLDQNPEVEIEENGPIRCVVRAKGQLVAEDGKTNLGYTLRMHFYKGKQRTRMIFTLRNASKQQLANVVFRSLELVLKTKLQQPSYIVATHDGEAKGQALGVSAKLRLFQGENNFPTIRENGFSKEVWPTGIAGYSLTLDGKDLKQGTREQPIPLFYAQIHQDAGPAVTFGTRFAAGYWPQGLGADGDGTIRIGVFPAGNDKPYVIRFNGHITREHMLHVADKAETPRTPFFKFQYPLMARPVDVDWFNQIEIWWERLISFKEESDYHAAMKWSNDTHEQTTLKRRPHFAIVRHRDWSLPRRPAVYSPAAIAMYNYLRREDDQTGGYYLMAEQMMLYNADLSAFHADDYNVVRVADEVPALSDGKGGFKDYTALPNADKLPSTPSLWTASYRYASIFQKWYFLTGDARFRDVYLNWGAYQQTRKDHDTPAKLAHNIRHLADLFEFTRNPLYQKQAWEVFEQEVVKKIAVKGSQAGWDRLRGFFIGKDQATAQDRKVRTFEQGGALLRAAITLETRATANDTQASQARDLIDSLSRFVCDQLYLSYGNSIGDFGFPFALSVDQKVADIRGTPDWNKGLEDAYLAVIYAYIMSHDESYMKLGEKLLQITAENPQKEPMFGDLPSRQMLQYLVENPLLFPTWRELPLQIDTLQDGRYRLTWVSPYNAMKFWFKMSEKPIVPSLGYDPKTGTYQSDPTKFTPFFAATYIDEQPKLVDPGVHQAMFVTAPDKSKKYYFAARYLSTDPRSAPTEAFAEASSEPGPSDTDRETPQNDGGTTPDTPSTQEKSTGESGTTADTPETTGTPGCQCEAGSSSGTWWLLLLCGLGLVLMRRRNRVVDSNVP